MSEKLIIKKQDGVGWLTLDKPEKRNAICFEMWQGLQESLLAFSRDDEIRVVVLNGAGDHGFSAGADISEFPEQLSSEHAIASYQAVIRAALDALDDLSKPSIAMLHGLCIGGGASIALHSDMRIAAQTTRIAIPVARIAQAYPWQDVYALVQLIGPAFSREMLYTGRHFTATEALRMGLVNRVVAEDDLRASVRETAEQISANAPLTIHSVKQTVREALKDPADRDLATIDRLVEACLTSSDCEEGYQAFIQKRRPEYKGR
ncbi:MAG: enoyl-CoA hydratase [Proteobacteria bacterium]|nr:enoyl-CoA hydratase [Pseudomonadota bacterium]